MQFLPALASAAPAAMSLVTRGLDLARTAYDAYRALPDTFQRGVRALGRQAIHSGFDVVRDMARGHTRAQALDDARGPHDYGNHPAPRWGGLNAYGRGLVGRATRRFRQTIRRGLNRRRRYRRRLRRNRRRARAHRRNPYTRHRQTTKRRVRAYVRRYRPRRRYRRRLIPYRRVNRWYSVGRWVLFGNVLNSSTANLGLNQEGFTMYYVSSADKYTGYTAYGNTTYTLPYATDTSNYAFYNSSIHFNALTEGTVGTADFAIRPLYGTYSNVNHAIMPGVFCSYSRFRYSATSDNYDTSTAYAMMPPVPYKCVSFSRDTQNPKGVAVGPTSTDTVFKIPYRCRWNCAYCKVSYAIKSIWPAAWGSLKGTVVNASSNVLPDNPPFYVRLIGVRYQNYTTENVTWPNEFVAMCFPMQSSITTRIGIGGKKALYTQSKGYIFFDKLWMFNGRIQPQFQAGEVLTDTEESSFIVKIPLPYTNINNWHSGSTSMYPSWPGAYENAYIQWYAFAAYKTQNFRYPRATDLQPQFSVTFRYTYYCFPKYLEPAFTGYYATGMEQLYSARSAVLKNSDEVVEKLEDTSKENVSVSNSVEGASLDVPPVPVSSDGSGLAETK